MASSPTAARLRATLPQAGYGQGEVLASPLRMARVVAAIASDGVLRDATRARAAGAAGRDEVLLTPAAAGLLGALHARRRAHRHRPRRCATIPRASPARPAPRKWPARASHSWFVGFAPYGPATRRVAFAVIVENAGYGGQAAASLAGEIVTAAASRRAGQMTANKSGVMARSSKGLMGRARATRVAPPGTVERASQRLTQSGAREPLEIAHAIVDLVEAQVHVSGRGRRVVPVNDIRVTVVAPTREARERYEAVFDGAVPLRERIAERLESLGCGSRGPDGRRCRIPARAKPGWVAPDFHLVFHRTDPSRAPPGR